MVVVAAESDSCDEIIKQRIRENLTYLEVREIGTGDFKGFPGVCKERIQVMGQDTEILKYLHQVDDNDTKRRFYHKSSTTQNASREYTGRIVPDNQRAAARERAEKLQRDLKNHHRSFVKPMVRSHVSGCFWLGLPRTFCNDFLPPSELRMVLEDEKGKEHDVLYLGRKNGLSGGWRGFAMDHNLEDGDALIFELIQASRFKVHIIKAIEDNGARGGAKTKKCKLKKEDKPVSQERTPRAGSVKKVGRPRKCARTL